MKVQFTEFPDFGAVRPLALDLRPDQDLLLVDSKLRGRKALVKALVAYVDQQATGPGDPVAAFKNSLTRALLAVAAGKGGARP